MLLSFREEKIKVCALVYQHLFNSTTILQFMPPSYSTFDLSRVLLQGFAEYFCSFKIESKCLLSLIFSVVGLEDEPMDLAVILLQIFPKPEVLAFCLTATITCDFAS